MLPDILLLLTSPEPPIKLPADEAKQTYELASLLMEWVRDLLSFFGLDHHPDLQSTIYIILVAAIAFGIGFALQKVVVWTVEFIARRLHAQWYQNLLDKGFFVKLCRIIPPIVFLILIGFTMAAHKGIGSVLTRITVIYMIVLISIAICTLVDASWAHIDAKDNKRRLPLRGVVQLVKGIIWLVALIIIVAYLLDRSPEKLLAGLGAFAAVLMLVFKDSILGVVAGVQLSENDSLHEGDWISVHGTDANGIVEEVSLTMVKIRNFDKTVTSLPPYMLVSGSFTNMRTMQLSNSRRIDRCYFIDADSVVQLSEQDLQKYSGLPFMKDYIAGKLAQQKEGKVQNVNNSAGLVDGTIETNLGLFRAYLKMYLDANKDIDHSSDCFITTLQQTTYGIPLQVYCFTDTSSWFAYEGIQAYIFEHIAVMLGRFGLYCFESVSGRDTLIDGYLSSGKDMEGIVGLPSPFMMPPAGNPVGASRNHGQQGSNADAPTLQTTGQAPSRLETARDHLSANHYDQGAPRSAPDAGIAPSALDGGK